MDSEVITEKIMNKLKKLKLLEPIEEHTMKSISIIMEETIDQHFEKIKPRTIHIHPTFSMERGVIEGKSGVNGRKSVYKFHLMEVGDVLKVDEKYELAVHQGFNYFIETHKPNWGFEKTKDGYGEVSFKRIK